MKAMSNEILNDIKNNDFNTIQTFFDDYRYFSLLSNCHRYKIACSFVPQNIMAYYDR